MVKTLLAEQLNGITKLNEIVQKIDRDLRIISDGIAPKVDDRPSHVAPLGGGNYSALQQRRYLPT